MPCTHMGISSRSTARLCPPSPQANNVLNRLSSSCSGALLLDTNDSNLLYIVPFLSDARFFSCHSCPSNGRVTLSLVFLLFSYLAYFILVSFLSRVSCLKMCSIHVWWRVSSHKVLISQWLFLLYLLQNLLIGYVFIPAYNYNTGVPTFRPLFIISKIIVTVLINIIFVTFSSGH